MGTFSKNEIVKLNKDLVIAPNTYPANTLFFVEKAQDKKFTIAELKDGAPTGRTLSADIRAFNGLISSTNTLYKKAKAVSVKKGDFFTFKTEFVQDEVKFPVGTRIVFTKGGANPAFETLYKQEILKQVNGLGVSEDFILKYLERAERAECEVTKDFDLKGVKHFTTRHGDGGFEASLYFKGKKIGNLSNDGYGGCNNIDIDRKYSADWDKLITKGLEFSGVIGKQEGIREITKHQVEETTVEFFLTNHNGLISYKEYIEAEAHEWLSYFKK